MPDLHDDGVSEGARALLALARGAGTAREADRARVLAGLSGKLAAGGVAGAGTAGIMGMSAVKAVLMIVIAASVAVGLHYAPVHAHADRDSMLRRTVRSEPMALNASEPASVHSPVAMTLPNPVAPASSDTPRLSSLASATHARTPNAERARSEDTLGSQLALLLAARRALRQHDPDGALRELSTLAALFPNTRFREEQQSLQIVALCAEGHVDEARRTAEVLMREAPHSPQIDRVRSSCAGSSLGAPSAHADDGT